MRAPVCVGLLFGDFDDFTALVLAALRAGAVRQLRLVAVRALGDAGQAQVIVRAAGRGAPLGVSTFRIRHLVSSFYCFRVPNFKSRNAVQRSSTSFVSQWQWPVFLFSPHCGQIPWHASLQTCCMGNDNRMYSRRTSASSIPPSIVKPDLGFAFIDGEFVGRVFVRSRPVKQVEIRVDRGVNRLKAPVAIRFDFRLHSTTDSNLAERITQQLGLPFGMKRTNLPQTAKIDLPGRKIHIEREFPQLEFLYTDKQHTPPPLTIRR